MPKAADLAELNRQLLAACQQDERRLIAGREQTVGAGMVIEREHLLPLAAEGADLAQTSFPTVNGLGCAKVLTNSYSVPLPAGTQVQAKAYASTIELWHGGRCVARHERCYRRQQQILDLEHYLDVLYRKPGALAGSKPLEQKRQAGLWPASFDRIWEALMERHGKPERDQTDDRPAEAGAEAWASEVAGGCGNALCRAVVPIQRQSGTC